MGPIFPATLALMIQTHGAMQDWNLYHHSVYFNSTVSVVHQINCVIQNQMYQLMMGI